MLIVYGALLMLAFGIYAMYKTYELRYLSSWILWIIVSLSFGFLLTAVCSCFSVDKNAMRAESVSVYEIVAVENYQVLENKYENYYVAYEADNLEVLECRNTNTVFRNSAEKPTIAIYTNDYKSPILRHLLFNWVDDTYVITCDFDKIKPYVQTS